jgi:ABC-type dipeptide/oligopeptide/nickel transport system permease component
MNLAKFYKRKPLTCGNLVMAVTGLIVGLTACLRRSTPYELFSNPLGVLSCWVFGYFAVMIVVLFSLIISWFVLSKIDLLDDEDTAKLILTSCTTLIVVSIALLLISKGLMYDGSPEIAEP